MENQAAFWTFKENKSTSSFQESNVNSLKGPSGSNSSIFGDADCGEPFEPQQLVIDFSPCDDDTEEATDRCIAFWDFVRQQPELEAMIAPAPDETNEDHSKDQVIHEDSSFREDPTAVSVLDQVEKAGLIDRAFATHLPQPHCSGGLLDYCDRPQTIPKTKRSHKTGKPKTVKTATKALCQQMNEWDEEHPKSMEPPKHPPALSHAIMQRKC